jgi:RNA polymerase sigma-70 factor (ECF subfamily)
MTLPVTCVEPAAGTTPVWIVAQAPGGEAELVRRARAGDRQAFEKLWRRHAPTVHAVVLSVLPAVHAEDAEQDVALAALSALGTLRNDDGFAAWVCAIARNRARTARSLLHKRGSSAPLDEQTAADPRDQRTTGQLEADEVLAALRSLPATYREPLTLRFLAGLSGPEIAHRLGMTHGSVRVTLCRGLKLLRQRLEPRAEAIVAAQPRTR